MSTTIEGGTAALPDPIMRNLITVSLIAATVMVVLDSTIANVALPHIRGSVSASQEEISFNHITLRVHVPRSSS